MLRCDAVDPYYFLEWFSTNAFGGTGYSNTPVGAVSDTDEPYSTTPNNPIVYFGLWAAGKPFALCVWISRETTHFQAVGDPFVKR
jgi:hypothetical protein